MDQIISITIHKDAVLKWSSGSAAIERLRIAFCYDANPTSYITLLEQEAVPATESNFRLQVPALHDEIALERSEFLPREGMNLPEVSTLCLTTSDQTSTDILIGHLKTLVARLRR